MQKYIFFLVCFYLTMQSLAAQTTDSLARTKVKPFVLPVVFYTPETKLGLGAGGIATWRAEQARYPSSLTFSFAYTFRRQILTWFPFQYYAPHTRWQAYGEIGYFKYVFDYFGIGNQVPNDFREKYNARFPRVRLNALKAVKGVSHFAGVRYHLDDFVINDLDSTGLLFSEMPLGATGGLSSGAGLVWQTDTRDKRFYPRSGWLIEASVYGEGKPSGSDFDYQRVALDGATYRAFGKSHVLALHGSATMTFGEVPFFALSTLGGTKRLRGYIEGKYRDQNAVLAQAEWRTKIYKRLGAVAFAGAGTVWGREGQEAQVRPNYGLGIRFALDAVQELNVRLDYGFGSDGNRSFYLTFGEAF